jgi:hypothetical protein
MATLPFCRFWLGFPRFRFVLYAETDQVSIQIFFESAQIRNSSAYPHRVLCKATKNAAASSRQIRTKNRGFSAIFATLSEFVSNVLKNQKNLCCSMGRFLFFVRTTVDFLVIWRYYIRGQSEHDRTKKGKNEKEVKSYA